MSPKTLNVGLAQQACTSDRDANLAASLNSIRELADHGAQLIVLPELHAHPYFCQIEDPVSFNLAEAIPGPTTHAISAIARELGVVVVASVFERRAPGLYHNTAVVIERDGDVIGTYRKMHIPDDPGYYEKYYFTPGDLGFTPIDTSVGRLGVLVCWDQWFPEAARLMALAGAELLLYPTAIGWNPDEVEEERQRQWEAWIIIQRAHAIANGIPAVVCNRVGFEPDPSGQTPGISFWGTSFIVGPQGEWLATASAEEPATLTAELDLSHSESVRRAWPYLRDRRIDAYGGLLKRYLDR
ncbi:MAG: carbon-nitrogen hydrolase [Candidatus Competibacteraceae bacterium]|nr:carbon-nitrogen hydrolase [Candidatus Competibacteraceae bacterium]